MKTAELPIVTPCDVAFGELPAVDAEGRVRHCSRCEVSVLDVSRHTEREARALLADGTPRCVRYLAGQDGAILFRHEAFVPVSSLRRRLTKALAVGVAAIAACATEACGGARPADRSPTARLPGLGDGPGAAAAAPDGGAVPQKEPSIPRP